MTLSIVAPVPERPRTLPPLPQRPWNDPDEARRALQAAEGRDTT